MSWSESFHSIAKMQLRNRKMTPLEDWQHVVRVAAEKGEMSYRYEYDIDEVGERVIQELKDEGFEVKILHPTENITWIDISWLNATEEKSMPFSYTEEYYKWVERNCAEEDKKKEDSTSTNWVGYKKTGDGHKMSFKDDIKKTILEKIAEKRAQDKETKRLELQEQMLIAADKGQKTLSLHSMDDITKEILSDLDFNYKFVPNDDYMDMRGQDVWVVDLVDEWVEVNKCI